MPVGQRHQPGQRAQRRGLAGAVRAEQGDAPRRPRSAGATSSGSRAAVDDEAGVEQVAGHALEIHRSRRLARIATETTSSTRLSTIAASQVGLQRQVDRQRHGLGLAREVAGEGDRRAELAERPGPAEHRAGRDPGRDERQRDPAEGGPPARAEGGRRLLVAGVGAAQRALDRDHQERHRDERLGDDHAGGRERQRDPERAVEPLADQPAPAEHQQQRDAADHRRQHQRHGHQRPHQPPARERRPGPAARPAARRAPGRPAVASVAVSSESRSAARMPGSASRSGSVDHGARSSSPTSGSTRNGSPSTAGTASASGAPAASHGALEAGVGQHLLGRLGQHVGDERLPPALLGPFFSTTIG